MASMNSDQHNDDEGTGKIYSGNISRQSPEGSVAVSSLSCVNHPDKEVIYFCHQHKVDCCELCLTKHHKQCKIIPISDINSEFSGFLRNVNRLSDNIEEARHDLKQHSTKIDSHTKLAETKIRLFYNDIRSKVDEAEKESLKSLYELRDGAISTVSSHSHEYERLKKQINDIIEKGKSLYKETNQSKSEVNERRGNDTELHFDVSLNVGRESLIQFRTRQKSTVELIQKQLVDGNEWSQTIDVGFMSLDECFADSLVSNLTSSIRLSPLHVVSPPYYKLEFDEECEYALITDSPYRLRMVPGSVDEVLVLISDPGGYAVQRIDLTNKVLGTLRLPTTPNDFSVYADSIAVTFSDRKLIKLYKLSTFIEYSEIKTSGICWGICRTDDAFIVTFNRDGLAKKIDDNGLVINSSGNIFKNPTCVKFSDYNEHILVSDAGNDRVVVLSEDLQRAMFTIPHPHWQSPFSVCSDMYGSIYTCCSAHSSVKRFTKDGKYDCEIISVPVTESLHDVCFSKSNTTLAILSEDVYDFNGIIRFYKAERS